MWGPVQVVEKGTLLQTLLEMLYQPTWGGRAYQLFYLWSLDACWYGAFHFHLYVNLINIKQCPPISFIHYHLPVCVALKKNTKRWSSPLLSWGYPYGSLLKEHSYYNILLCFPLLFYIIGVCAVIYFVLFWKVIPMYLILLQIAVVKQDKLLMLKNWAVTSANSVNKREFMFQH